MICFFASYFFIESFFIYFVRVFLWIGLRIMTNQYVKVPWTAKREPIAVRRHFSELCNYDPDAHDNYSLQLNLFFPTLVEWDNLIEFWSDNYNMRKWRIPSEGVWAREDQTRMEENFPRKQGCSSWEQRGFCNLESKC
jgi:hypothetical protein